MSAFKYLGLNNFHASIRWFLHIWILLYLRSGQLLGQLEIWVSFRAFAHEWPKACLKSGSVQHRKCAPPQLQGSKENQVPNMNKMISHSLGASKEDQVSNVNIQIKWSPSYERNQVDCFHSLGAPSLQGRPSIKYESPYDYHLWKCTSNARKQFLKEESSIVF